MISIFTASHDTKFLHRAEWSLIEQTEQDWEWIVLLNGPAIEQDWERSDARTIVLHSSDDSGFIGALKAEAVAHCKGDIIIELDHDDELAPDALEKVKWAFNIDPSICFVYSDTAQIDEDSKPDLSEFSADHGWLYYTEGEYKAAMSFEPFPHNVSYIWYAPNHLRAFRGSAYDAVGGYNTNLEVLDDQDLMARLYQYGEFYHLPYCLYFQRVHSGNTQRDPEKNARIQRETQVMYHETIEANALAWAERRGLLALDLGAYHNKREGYLGVDMREGESVDYVSDFLDLDLPDNSVGVIRAVDFLEHTPDRIRVMEKIWRLLAHGGMLLSDTPSADGRGAFQDPTHISYWNENSFWYFTDPNYKKYIETEADFHTSLLYTYYPSEFHQIRQIPYVRANLVAMKNYKSRLHPFGGTKYI